MGDLNVYGINGQAAPYDVSYIGGTALYVPFYYGQIFDEVYCWVDGVQSEVASYEDGLGFLCVTNPHNSSGINNRPVQVEVRAVRGGTFGNCLPTEYEEVIASATVELAYPCFTEVSKTNVEANFAPVATFYQRDLNEGGSRTFYFRGEHLPSELLPSNFQCVYDFYFGALYAIDTNAGVRPLATRSVPVQAINVQKDGRGVATSIIYECNYDPEEFDVPFDFTQVLVRIGWGSDPTDPTVSVDPNCKAALTSTDLNAPFPTPSPVANNARQTPTPTPAPLASLPYPSGVSIVGGTVIFVPFRGGDYFEEVYCNIEGQLFFANWTGNGFNCVGADLGDELSAISVALLLFPECAQTPCDARRDFFVTSDTACLVLDSPCASLVAVDDESLPAPASFFATNFSSSGYSFSASFDRHIREVTDGHVHLRGRYLPTEVTGVDFVCIYSFHNEKLDAFRPINDPVEVRIVNLESITPNFDSNGVASPVYTCPFRYDTFDFRKKFDPASFSVQVGWRDEVDNSLVIINPSNDCLVVVSPASSLSVSAVVVAMFASVIALLNF